MLLIWGFRTLLTVIASGHFACPHCETDAAYQHVRPRRWFTIFFIPLIPGSWRDAYVECQRCKNCYSEAVLTRPTNAQFQYALDLGIKAALLEVLRASAREDDKGLDHARVMIGQHLSSAGYDWQQFQRDRLAFASTTVDA